MTTPRTVRLRLKDADGVAQLIHPETNAGMVIETTNRKFITSEEKANLLELESMQAKLSNLIYDNEFTEKTIVPGVFCNIDKLGRAYNLPDIDITSNSYINILGPDGNCESTSVFNPVGLTLSTDVSKKVVGDYAMKMVLTSTIGTVTLDLSNYFLDKTKCYLLTAFVDSGTASSIELQKVSSGGGTVRVVNHIGNMTRVAIKLDSSDFGDVNNIVLYVSGTVGQIAYVDGIMLHEISTDEYASGLASTIMTKYPYGEGIVVTACPSVSIISRNLVRNGNVEEGNSYWTPSKPEVLFVMSNDKRFLLTSSLDSGYVYQRIEVEKNVDYTITWNKTSGSSECNVFVMDLVGGVLKQDSVGNFNSGNNSIIEIRLSVNSTGYSYFKEIQLVKGTEIPNEYQSFKKRSAHIDGFLTKNDKISIKGGKVCGRKSSNFMNIFGKDYEWSVLTKTATYVVVSLNNNQLGKNIRLASESVHDWLKRPYKHQEPCTIGRASSATTNDFRISLLNSDTGWDETTPLTPADVAAWFNGWKATANDGTKFTQWTSVVTTLAPDEQSAQYVSRVVSPRYNGYGVMYDYNYPIEIDEDCDNSTLTLRGDVLCLEEGFNVIKYDSGLIHNEIVLPILTETQMAINSSGWTTAYPPSRLKYKSDEIKQIYTDGTPLNLIEFGKNAGSADWYGTGYAIASSDVYDRNSIYSVDYILSRVDYPNLGSIVLNLEDSPALTMDQILDILDRKQDKSVLLDKLGQESELIKQLLENTYVQNQMINRNRKLRMGVRF